MFISNKQATKHQNSHVSEYIPLQAQTVPVPGAAVRKTGNDCQQKS
jgi:hypothetical protein